MSGGDLVEGRPAGDRVAPGDQPYVRPAFPVPPQEGHLDAGLGRDPLGGGKQRRPISAAFWSA